jgi:hypothetical protein
MTKEFFVIKNQKGQLVQTWTFAPNAFITFCRTFDWSMKFNNKEQAEKRLSYFFKNKFKNAFGLKITKIQENKFYKEIR